MAGITVSGLGSGLDINGMVTQLVAAETQPRANRLNVKEARLQAELSAFGSLKSSLSQLQDALTTLSDAESELTTTSSKVDVISASVTNTAIAGSYSVEISKLASACLGLWRLLRRNPGSRGDYLWGMV